MRIALGADHGGYALKNEIAAHLAAAGHQVEDYGTFSEDSCHYPIFAGKVANAVAQEKEEMGILVCGTGIGVSMAANKVKGIRAALAGDCYSAKMTRLHNNANVLCLGARVLGSGLALMIVDTFLSTPFEGGRHQDRVDLIHGLESK